MKVVAVFHNNTTVHARISSVYSQSITFTVHIELEADQMANPLVIWAELWWVPGVCGTENGWKNCIAFISLHLYYLYLSDAFIQSDLQKCVHGKHYHTKAKEDDSLTIQISEYLLRERALVS